MSYHGRFESPKPKKKKRGLKIFLIILIVVLVLAAAAVIAGVTYYKSMLNRVNIVEMPTRPTETAVTEMPTQTTEAIEETTFATEETTVETTVPPMTADDIVNILVVGQSSRAGEEGRLADTMILASINKYTKKLTLTSFLRDTYVDLPDYTDSRNILHPCGWNKLTTCYALGYSWGGAGDAMAMMNMCLEDNFGVEVDYNVEIDFDCFITLVDALNGVALEITQEEADYLNADDLFVSGEYEAGWANLDGSAALSYARMRKASGDNDSDIKRTSRQRYLIEALLNNIRNASLSQLQSLLNEILPMITTNMSTDKITEFLIEILPMLPEMGIEQGTCPAEGTYWPEEKDTPDGLAYVLMFESAQQKKLMRAITEAEIVE